MEHREWSEKLGGRRGTIVIILLGLISVMWIFGYWVSQRMSGQGQIVTVADATQVARFFLESYTQDVLHQLRAQINTEGSKPYDDIRGLAAGGSRESPLNIDYSPCSFLTNLENTWKISERHPPEIKLLEIEPLPYPACLTVPAKVRELEYQGKLQITCRITLLKRKYFMTIKYPFKLVMVLTPVLRDFVLYVDQLHLEQTENIGDGDQLNLLLADKSDYAPKPTPSTGNTPKDGLGMPWVLSTPLPGLYDLNGKVFLGKEKLDANKGIYLNLAGERHARSQFSKSFSISSLNTKLDPGEFCDLWWVDGSLFKDPTSGQVSRIFNEPSQLFSVNHNDNSLRSKKIQTTTDVIGQEYEQINLCLLGFSKEINQAGAGHFASTNWELEDFLNDDTVFKAFMQKGREHLGYSSALRLFGKNQEVVQKQFNLDYFQVERPIFGKIFHRFILLSLYQFSSMSGGIQVIPYSDDPGAADKLPKFDKHDGSDWKFEALGTYQSYMSQIVSKMSANRVKVAADGSKTLSDQFNSCLGSEQFATTDGITFKDPLGKGFDRFSPEWFAKKDSSVPAQQELLQRSILTRVSKYFPNRAEFERYAFKKNGDQIEEFILDGVVFVDDDWVAVPPISSPDETPAALTISSDKIKGGILICRGQVILGDITRGLDVSSEEKIRSYLLDNKKAEEILRSFMTFVSLSPSVAPYKNSECIKLCGNSFLGVHLIAMSPDPMGAAAEMISVAKTDDPVRIFGGVAASSLKMNRQVQKSAKPLEITYIPWMASPKIPTRAEVSSAIRGYDFFIDSD
jgi:hypothetical protein